MLVRYQDRIFLQKDRWFMWDTALDLFRPIDSFAWTGTTWELDDRAYRMDPTDKTYCFGSPEMLATCVELSKIYRPVLDTVPTAEYISIGTPVWFRDRLVNFTHAAPKDVPSWKRLVNGHARTCKRRSSKKFTKRTL